MNTENKIIKLIGMGVLICLIGIFTCMISILNTNSRLEALNSALITINETEPSKVITLPENRIAILNNQKGSPNYGSVNIYEYDKDRKTFNLISRLFQ